jgi:hypothetical protein
VSGKWRALTKSSVDKLLDGGKTSFSSYVTKLIAERLSAIMIIAGCYDAIYAYKTVTEKFESKLALITKSVLELRRVTGEKITSCDMSVFGYLCETPFDAALMFDDFNNGAKPELSSGGVVLCTTELGLRLAKSVSKDGRAEYVEETILMPKVVLQSAVEDMVL